MQTALIPAASVRIGRRTFPFTSLEHVSAAYSATIDRVGSGSRATPACDILDGGGNRIAYVSYNGRVWAADKKAGDAPLYDASGFYGDPQDDPRCYASPEAFARSVAAA